MFAETQSEVTPIMISRDQPNFVETPHVREIVKRALIYIQAGFPVHFMGPSGTGKTTLAMYVAGQLGRPVVLVHGDEEFTTSDLVGGEYGFRRKKLVDNFVHSILRTEEDVSMRWVDNRVTVACKNGYTFFYDEFTRSRPEANNVLLSILEEKILDLPAARGGDGHLRIHPDFCAIFTSNPQEYAGVHKAQDALMDRMLTIRLDHYDQETEIAIAQAKSGISRQDAEKIVGTVKEMRKNGHDSMPTVRASIMIAKVLKVCGAQAAPRDPIFIQTCKDALESRVATDGSGVEMGRGGPRGR